MSEPSANGATRIDNITTLAAVVGDAGRLVMRYGPAIRRYLGALVRSPDDADDVSQSLLVEILNQGFARRNADRGRFRDYLRAAARNVARTHLRKSTRRPTAEMTDVADPAADPVEAAADQDWAADWQRSVLEMALKALELYEFRHRGNLFHTVLKLSAEHPEETSDALAARLSAQLGRTVTPAAFRMQQSRARRLLAQFLVDEVAQTMSDPRPERVEEELIEIGLMRYVRDFLPADWRTRGKVVDPERADAD